MKTNSNNHDNAVFSSTLPILAILLVITLAFAGKLNAGQNSTGANIESVPELQTLAEVTESSPQETEAGKYERYYRTLISDPVDGREKLVELRYTKDGKLTEVLIDDETLTLSERRKNDKIIRKAMAEERNIGKEVDQMIDGIGQAVEETMGVISDLFGSDLEQKTDQEACEADSRGDNTLPVTRRRDRKERIRTLEELESANHTNHENQF